MDLKAKTVHPEDVPLPPLLLKLTARMQGQVRLISPLVVVCSGPGSRTLLLSEQAQSTHDLQVPVLRGFKPNEANAIDYVQSEGHELRAHFDDRLAHPGHLLRLCMLALLELPVAVMLPPSGCP